MNNTELQEYVQAYLAGDESSFEKIYEITHNSLYLYALKLNNKEDDALDLVQETYIEVIKSIHNLRESQYFKTWMIKILINLSRKKYRNTLKDFDLLYEDNLDMIDNISDQDEKALPEMAYDVKEVKGIINNIIDHLPASQRIALLSYYYDEMNLKQIAELMDCSENTVKSRLYYGRNSIKSNVEDYEKKHGIKMYSITPLLLIIFGKMGEDTVMAQEASSSIFQTVINTAGINAAPTSSTVVSASGATGQSSTITVSGAATSKAGMIAGIGTTKLIAVVITGALAIGGVGYYATHSLTDKEPKGSVDVQAASANANTDSNSGEGVTGDSINNESDENSKVTTNESSNLATDEESTTFGIKNDAFSIVGMTHAEAEESFSGTVQTSWNPYVPNRSDLFQRVNYGDGHALYFSEDVTSNPSAVSCGAQLMPWEVFSYPGDYLMIEDVCELFRVDFERESPYDESLAFTKVIQFKDYTIMITYDLYKDRTTDEFVSMPNAVDCIEIFKL